MKLFEYGSHDMINILSQYANYGGPEDRRKSTKLQADDNTMDEIEINNATRDVRSEGLNNNDALGVDGKQEAEMGKTDEANPSNRTQKTQSNLPLSTQPQPSITPVPLQHEKGTLHCDGPNTGVSQDKPNTAPELHRLMSTSSDALPPPWMTGEGDPPAALPSLISEDGAASINTVPKSSGQTPTRVNSSKTLSATNVPKESCIQPSHSTSSSQSHTQNP